MKPGEKIQLSNEDLMAPLVGRLVEVKLPGKDSVKARIVEVGPNQTQLTVVSNDTRE